MNNLWIPLKVGGREIKMYIDSGCEFTIIPPTHYKQTMGVIRDHDTNLRAWGSSELLDVRGMIITKLSTTRGAKKTAKVFIVNGFHPEPLLGATDAEDLGFITINKEGRQPRQEEGNNNSNKERACIKQIGIPQKIRENLKIEVDTHPEDNRTATETEIAEVMKTVQSYEGVVFNDNKVGKLITTPIHLEYDKEHIPEQPRFHNVPIHYQPEVSKLLKFLRQQNVITDVDPRDPYECIMNVVL